MVNNPPDGWGDMSYAEKEAWRRGQMNRDERDERALRRLERGDKVRAPEGWTGFVAELVPERLEVYVESYERGGTYRASEVEPLEGAGSVPDSRGEGSVDPEFDFGGGY